MTYKDLLVKEYEEQLRSIESADCVILYGNSVIASILKVAISDLISRDIVCYVFDNGRFIDCDSADMARSGDKCHIILCSIRQATRQSMRRDAEDFFPRSNSYDFFAVYYAWITEVIQRDVDDVTFAETLYRCRSDEAIPNIDSINTLYCNLKCKECSNGIPYRQMRKRISAETQIYYLEKITDKMAIAECNFQGGEVFTDVGFSEFLYEHSKNSRIAILTIATNGTILPSDNDFKTIRKTGAMLRVSNYGALSTKKEQIMQKCKEYGVPCFYFPKADTWRKFGAYEKRNRSYSERKDISATCCFGTHDLMFLGNKLYCCLRTLYGSVFDEANEDITANTLNLDSNFSVGELTSIIQGEQLWRMCDYCDNPMEIIRPAEQLE